MRHWTLTLHIVWHILQTRTACRQVSSNRQSWLITENKLLTFRLWQIKADESAWCHFSVEDTERHWWQWFTAGSIPVQTCCHITEKWTKFHSGHKLLPMNSWWSELEFYYWKRAGKIVGKPWWPTEWQAHVLTHTHMHAWQWNSATSNQHLPCDS